VDEDLHPARGFGWVAALRLLRCVSLLLAHTGCSLQRSDTSGARGKPDPLRTCLAGPLLSRCGHRQTIDNDLRVSRLSLQIVVHLGTCGETQLKVGDYVRVTGIPQDLPNLDGDDLRTKDIFERCLGRVFPVTGFQGKWLELEVGEVVGAPACMHTIWIEPEFVELVRGAEQDRS
jgi:hypothetical protein